MFFVRAVFEEEEEWTVQCLLAGMEPAGIDEGNLADGRREFLVYFDGRNGAEACAAALGSFAQGVEEEPEQNWNAVWQQGWAPMEVGRRWFLVPPGADVATPVGRIRLEYHPGTAFGNGDHPTTQLCLEWIEELVRPGDVFVDAGCGSGLLCQAAAALGARAVGFDLDEAAVRKAREYGVAAFAGSADAVGRADVVVANIQLGVLCELLPDLRRIAMRELVLSGLLTEQAGEFAGERRDRSGWSAVRLAQSGQ